MQSFENVSVHSMEFQPGIQNSDFAASGGNVSYSTTFALTRRTSSSLMQRSAENDIVLMNEVYKERFPAAAAQMEEKLTELVSRISLHDA